jgi:hypothetical protein
MMSSIAAATAGEKEKTRNHVRPAQLGPGLRPECRSIVDVIVSHSSSLEVQR